MLLSESTDFLEEQTVALLLPPQEVALLSLLDTGWYLQKKP